METRTPQVSQHGTDPFRFWVVDNFLNAGLVAGALAQVPAKNWPHWVRYANDCEHGKRTCNDLEALGPSLAAALSQLHADWCAVRLHKLTGIDGLIADPHLHGAGLHVTEPGGWLQVHGDYELHPKLTGWERRLSVVLCLNECTDGELLLCNGWGTSHQQLATAPNRALIFENGPASFHGVKQVMGATDRVTLAAYYLAPARPTAVRRRAMFLPNRDGGTCPSEVR